MAEEIKRDPNITYFAETDFRNKKTPFGIKAEDRTRHVYVIGKTGMGKSTMLENMAVHDIKNGNGIAFIDPHGKTADLLLEYVPKERIKDVIYFAPHDTEFPISFNVMEDVGKDQRHLVASGLMAAFKKIWPDVWSARMEYISMNILLALLEYPGSTLLGVNRMLSDKNYRNKVVNNITDPSVKAFWTEEFAKYTDKFMVEASASIQNKFGQFTSNPLIRNLMGQPKSSFDLRKIMDEKKILIINLSKGRLGETNSNLIGGMLITKIYLAAMSRANANEEEMKKLPNFYLFVDEFQSFVNDSFADILSEARKYKLNLTVAHQYIEQMPETVRNAVFGNVGTTIAFRVGPFDAEVLEKMFMPKFTAEDLVNLGFAQIYLTLMIDGVGSAPFSARTLPPVAKEAKNYVPEIIKSSREQFARPREAVEVEIRKWHEALPEEGGGWRSAPDERAEARPRFNQSVGRRPFGVNEGYKKGPISAPLNPPYIPKNAPQNAPYVPKNAPKRTENQSAVNDTKRLHLTDLKANKDLPKASGSNVAGLKSALQEAFNKEEKKSFSLDLNEGLPPRSEAGKIEPWEPGDSGYGGSPAEEVKESPFHEFMSEEGYEEPEAPAQIVEEIEGEEAEGELQSATEEAEDKKIGEVPEEVLKKVIRGGKDDNMGKQ